jgi:hypothetical protein
MPSESRSRKSKDRPARAVVAQLNHNPAKRQSYALNHMLIETASLVDTMRELAQQKFYYYDLDALKS